MELTTLTCSHFTLSGRPAVISAHIEGLKIDVPTKPKLNLFFKWFDVLGANATTESSIYSVNDNMPLVIHTLEKGKNGKRKSNSILLQVNNGVHQHDIDQWIKIIIYFTNPMLPSFENLPNLGIINDNQPKKRTFLVLINPVAGQGKAEKLFKKVESFFINANIDIVKILTTRSGHAMEIANTLDMKKYDALVVVGGDGVAYEVVQGLMQRSDWSAAIQFPLAVLPAGGGNGLAKSLTEAAGEISCFENNAYLIVKGKPLPLDLASLRNKTTTSYIFLSLSWAFMADVDLESEKYRFAGSQRFALAALGKIMSGKTWNGSFSYLEADANESVPLYWDSTHTNESASSPQLELLPPTPNDPKPTSWKTIEGEFSLFWAMNVAWPGTDAHAAPNADLDDGYLHCVLIQGKTSKTDFLGLLLCIENGTHVEKPFIQVIKTRAFEVQAPSADIMMADGEKFEGGFCQAEVHRGLGRVLGIRNQSIGSSFFEMMMSAVWRRKVIVLACVIAGFIHASSLDGVSNDGDVDNSIPMPHDFDPEELVMVKSPNTNETNFMKHEGFDLPILKELVGSNLREAEIKAPVLLNQMDEDTIDWDEAEAEATVKPVSPTTTDALINSRGSAQEVNGTKPTKDPSSPLPSNSTDTKENEDDEVQGNEPVTPAPLEQEDESTPTVESNEETIVAPTTTTPLVTTKETTLHPTTKSATPKPTTSIQTTPTPAETTKLVTPKPTTSIQTTSPIPEETEDSNGSQDNGHGIAPSETINENVKHPLQPLSSSYTAIGFLGFGILCLFLVIRRRQVRANVTSPGSGRPANSGNYAKLNNPHDPYDNIDNMDWDDDAENGFPSTPSRRRHSPDFNPFSRPDLPPTPKAPLTQQTVTPPQSASQSFESRSRLNEPINPFAANHDVFSEFNMVPQVKSTTAPKPIPPPPPPAPTTTAATSSSIFSMEMDDHVDDDTTGWDEDDWTN